MPDPITWYALGRDIFDNQTIIEEIQAELLAHNQDASAHGQSSEAVYNHRIAELLDHVSYSIYNSKMNPAARIYQAIVGPGFEADFTTIQQAIDWAHLYGGGIVHIKAGTYVQSQSLVLYSDIILEGEDDDLSVLDFNNLNIGILIEGTSGTHKKNITLRGLGIINAWNGNGAVYLDYADDILIEECRFENNAESTATYDVTIQMNHPGRRITIRRNRFIGGNYLIALGTFKDVFIYENYFTENTQATLSGWACSHVIFRDNILENSPNDANADSCIFFEDNIAQLMVEVNQFIGCLSKGLKIQTTDKAVITGNAFHGVAGSSIGIDISQGDRNVITGNSFENYDSDGIWIETGDYNVITGNTINSNGGYGVNISNSGANKNVVVGNVIVLNSSGAINDLGTGTVKDHNAT